MQYKNLAIEKKQEEIEFAESCGLTYTGDEKFPYVGNNKAWATYNDGGY